MGFTASSEYLRLIKNFSPRFQLDPGLLYKKAGFEASTLEKSGARIPAEQFHALWDALEEINPDQDLGLHVGEKIFIFTGHILFLLMLNAPTIKDAIDKFCRYFNLLNDFTSPHFSIRNNLAEMSIRLNSPELTPNRHISEGILTSYASVLHRISENKIRFEGVYFTHSRPGDLSEHDRIFSAPLFFGRAENKLVFKRKYLSLPIPLSNKDILGPLEQLAQKLQEQLYVHGPWSDKVSRIVLATLNGKKPEIQSIAKQLGVSHRILQNRLKSEGVTYQALLNDARRERAIQFLQDKNIPINEIAFLLGYSEHSAFGRAFKRWVGCTPGEYRSRLK
jgi:AraC-like DNA-binding protein